MRKLTLILAAIMVLVATVVTGSELIIDVPADSTATGTVAIIPIQGTTAETLHALTVITWPREGVTCLVGRPLPLDTVETPNPPRIVFHATLPGKYLLAVATTDAEGTLQTAEAVLVVGGDPEPDPPVPPDGKWQVVIVYESNQLDNLPPDQQSIIKSLTFRDRLSKAGHQLFPGGIWDKDAPNSAGTIPELMAPYLRACKDDDLPRLCISPKDGGTIRTFALPKDTDAVMTLLGGAKP